MTIIDWSDVENAATEMVGNHERFDSFCWHEPPDDAENWCLVYTHNRDSDLLEESNADAIRTELEPFMESGDVRSEHHGHWACGWIDGYAIRVFDDAGEVTEAFRTWCYLKERLADYPLLDEEDFSRKEFEAALEAIESEGRRHVRDDAPTDWSGEVYSWLSDNEADYPHELENRDGTGAYPSEDAIRAALLDLAFLDARYQVLVGNSVYFETDIKAHAEREFSTLVYHASMWIGAGAGQPISLQCDDDILDEFNPNEKGA